MLGKGREDEGRKEMAMQSIGRAEKGLPHRAPPLAPGSPPPVPYHVPTSLPSLGLPLIF